MHSEQQNTDILTMEELNQFYADLQKKCQMLQDFLDPGISVESLIQKFAIAQKYITSQQLFSENEKIKQIHTEHLKFLTLPYYIGMLYGRITNPRKQAIQQSRNYFEAYLTLLQIFHCEDEELFPANILKTWKIIKEKKDFNLQRDQIIANHKEKKIIEERYKNHQKIKEESEQRASIKQFLMLKQYQSVSQLKTIHEELQILQYKQTLSKDPQQKKKHEEEQQKPIPKMKVWQIQKPEQIHSCMCPQKNAGEKKQQLIAQVWQQNANKPTITLQQVAQMQIDNMRAREQRERKYRQENKVDTDSDKQQVDDRQKKEARAWDDWKDAHEKGAGNKGNR